MKTQQSKYVAKAFKQFVRGARGRLIWSKVDDREWVTDSNCLVRVPAITEIDIRVELFRKFECMVEDGKTLSMYGGDAKESNVDLNRVWHPEEATIEGRTTPLRWDDKRICAFPNGVLIALQDEYVRLATNDRCWSRAKSGADAVYFGDDDGRYILAAPIHVKNEDVGQRMRDLITVRVPANVD